MGQTLPLIRSPPTIVKTVFHQWRRSSVAKENRCRELPYFEATTVGQATGGATWRGGNGEPDWDSLPINGTEDVFEGQWG